MVMGPESINETFDADNPPNTLQQEESTEEDLALSRAAVQKVLRDDH